MYVMSGLFLVHVNNNEVGTRLFLKGLIWPRKQDIRFLGQKSLTGCPNKFGISFKMF